MELGAVDISGILVLSTEPPAQSPTSTEEQNNMNLHLNNAFILMHMQCLETRKGASQKTNIQCIVCSVPTQPQGTAATCNKRSRKEGMREIISVNYEYNFTDKERTQLLLCPSFFFLKTFFPNFRRRASNVGGMGIGLDWNCDRPRAQNVKSKTEWRTQYSFLLPSFRHSLSYTISFTFLCEFRISKERSWLP